MKLFQVAAIVGCIAILGCKEDNVNIDQQLSSMSVQAISVDDYALLKRIPERAKDRKEEAFSAFKERTLIADYLLTSALKADASVHLSLLEAKNRILINQYFDNYLDKSITEEQAREYYESNKSDFKNKKYELAHILLKVRGNDEAEQISVKADRILKDLDNGLAFSVAVETHSQDTLTKDKKGHLGQMDSRNTDPAIIDAVSSLSVGEISAPVKTMRGFHIFKVLAVESDEVAFESVQEKIIYALRQTKRDAEYKRLLQEIGKS